MSLARLAERLRAGELSPREAVESYLRRIERLNPTLNAYLSVRAEQALAEAAALERRRARPLLYGVPVGIKDVIDVASAPTTAASRILAGNVARRDAVCVQRLRQAGAIVLGKLNTHELAYGATTTSPHFGPARNPWALDRICGGSSGGSGCAVAADLAAGTLGTDTAGSIRIPACYCGVTGVRPSTGLVPNEGVIPVSWTLDTVGPIARSAEDCSLLLQALVPGRVFHLDGGIGGLRVGLVRELVERAAPQVAAAVETAAGTLAGLGATVCDVEVPGLDEAGVANQLVMLPEAACYHLPWLRQRLAEYGRDVRARLLAGLFLPPTAHVTGLRAQRWYRQRLASVFEQVDLLAAPTMPVPAPPIGEEDVELRGRRLPYRRALIPFNSPWSFAGLPVVSVPCGFAQGLPVGMALVGRRLGDATVLAAAHAYQQATDWHERRPPLPAV